MSVKYSLISALILTTILSACGSGSQRGNENNTVSLQPGAIVPPAITVSAISHGTPSSYVSATDNMYYTSYLVSNKSSKSTSLSTVQISGQDVSEFAIESDTAKYPTGVTPCNSGTTLSPSGSCQILVKLVNPTAVTLTTKTANLVIVAGGVKFAPTLSKTSYAYVTGNFSQVYANPSESVSALTPVSDANSYCGINAKCQLVEFNLSNHNLNSIMASDYPVNSLALSNNGILYAGGGLTQASANGNTVSVANVGSLLVSINPALNGKSGILTDVLAQNNVAYPNDQIYSLAYNNNRLYIAGGFQSMAGVGDGATGYPVVTYDTTGVGSINWSNAFSLNSNNPDLAVSTIGFDKNNTMFISGLYSNLDGTQYIPESMSNTGNFVINSCASSDNGISFTCNADYASITSTTTDPNAMPQPASNISFSPDGTLYASGGFSKINSTDNGDGNYMIATLPALQQLSSTWSSLLQDNFPDNVISATVPYDNGKYYVGGFFSSIGGISSDSNSGICGAGALSYSGTNSCLLAQYDGSNYNKVFTTDGWINSIVFASKIGS